MSNKVVGNEQAGLEGIGAKNDEGDVQAAFNPSVYASLTAPSTAPSKASLKKRLAGLSPEQRQQLLMLIAQRRKTQADAEAAGAAVELKSAESPALYGLSRAQRRFWIASQLGESASAAYNIAAAFHFPTGLDGERLESAWRALLDRHSILRSAFKSVRRLPSGDFELAVDGEEIAQSPRSSAEWSLSRTTLSVADSPEASLSRFAEQEASQAPNLEQDWLVKLWLVGFENSAESGLVIVIHHTVCDGVSIPILTRELGLLYSDQSDLLAPANQYWEEVDAELTRESSRSLDYWLERFAVIPEPLPISTDYPRPPQRSFAGASVTLEIEAQPTHAFEALCADNRASFYMGCVALTQLILARFSGHTDITIGTPVAGRLSSTSAQTVGPFVNTIVLRDEINLEESFSTLLARAREVVLSGFAHQDLPFDSLLNSLELTPDPSHTPLFDVMLGLNAADEGTLSLGGNQGKQVRLETSLSKVDLTFHLERQRDGSLHLELEYSTSLFSRNRMTSLASAWKRLLMSVIEQGAGTHADQLALICAAERSAFLSQEMAEWRWNGVESIAERFSAMAAAYPNEIAVRASNRSLSYAELEEKSSAVAHWLTSEYEIKPEEPVGIMLEKSERMIVALLGILKCGGAYLPLTLDTPTERADFVLDDAGVRVLLTEGSGLAQTEMSDLALARVDFPSLLDGLGEGPQATVKTSSSSLAYIMYTSGSTGVPKGTLVEQRSVLRLVLDANFHQVQAGENVLQTGSLAFDASTFEIWGALLNGGCCCIPPGHSLLEVNEFDKLVEDYGTDTAFMTTGLFNQLVEYNVSAFKQLSTVLTGGEKISISHVNKLVGAFPSLSLLHVYGPTENTTFSSFYRIEGHQQQGTVPIGKPISGSSLLVLDRHLEPVPLGFPGEIVCGGLGLARGYLARPDMDSKAFTIATFSPGLPQRLYRTGDIGFWNSEKELVFLGRNDQQVKIRGFRVELGEVDAFLRGLDGVSDAAAVAKPNGITNELVAFVILDKASETPQGEPDAYSQEESLRAALRPLVPTYMVPSRFIFLTEFPLNTSGKVDIKKLMTIEPTDQSVETKVDAARPVMASKNGEGVLDAKQQRMLELYSAILGNSHVTLNDNFFALGGDSIKAIQLVAQARQSGYRFALADLFSAETLSHLCERIQVDADEQADPLLTDAPLSPIQRWWLLQDDTPRDHFSLSTVMRVTRSVDCELLEACVESLVATHPALRTTLDLVNQRQQITEEGGYHFSSIAIDSPREETLNRDQSKQVDDFWKSLQANITLTPPRLISVGVINFRDETLVGLVVHHLAADEVTGRLLSSNLEKLFNANNSREAILAIAEGLAYTNWSEKLSVLAKQGHFDADLAFWEAEVKEAKTLPRFVPVVGSKRVSHAIVLSQEASTKMLELAREKTKAAPLEAIASAFAEAWRKTTGAERCLVSMESHGREETETLRGHDATVGWFTAMYPLVLNACERGVDALLVNKDHIRGLPRKGLSYGPLRFYSTPERESALDVSPALSFNFLGASASSETESLFTALPRSVGENTSPSASTPFIIDAVCSLQSEEGEHQRISLQLQGVEEFTRVGVNETFLLESLLGAWVQSIDELERDLSAASAQMSVSDYCAAECFSSKAEIDTLLSAAHLIPGDVEDILPVTALQSGLYLHSAGQRGGDLSHSGGAYSDQVCLRLSRLLDVDRLAHVYSVLLDENQALRTRFLLADNGQVVQAILSSEAQRASREGCTGFEFFDLRNPEAGASLSIESLRRDRRQRGFDLGGESPFRLALVHLPSGQSELLFDFHHIAIDGWSSSLLLNRIQALYDSAVLSIAGEPLDQLPANVPPKLSNYYKWLASQPTADALEYWGELLGDYRFALQVPSAAPRSIEKSESDLSPIFVETKIEAAVVDALTRWCAQNGATLSAAVQAIWGMVLARETGTRDVVFGATVAGRDAPVDGLDQLVGMFINTLPVRITFDAQGSFADKVAEVAQQFSRSIDYGYLPLADIQALSPAGSNLLSHTVVFENYPASGDEVGSTGWNWETVDIFDPMHFEFGLIVAPVDGEIRLRFVADGALYDESTLARLGREISTLASAAVTESASGPAWTLAQSSRNSSNRAWSISANFTADLLETKLAFWEALAGTARAVHLLPYDQVLQELMNPSSALYQIESTEHIILWRSREGEDPAKAIGNADFLLSALRGYTNRVSDPCVRIVLCPSQTRDSGEANRIHGALASHIERACASLEGVSYDSLASLASDYSLEDWCLAEEEIVGDVPYSDDFFAALATSLFRQRDLRERTPIKVIAVDADETLWGGIVGEEGPDGVTVSGVYAQLQTRLSELRTAGYLLCMVTKNNYEDVVAAFDANEMPLKLSDFTRVCASWGPKSASIKELAEDLSLGLDSFLFLDDSPVECDEVRKNCPTVRTLQVPAASERAAFLANLWLLDAGESTAEDVLRAQSYSDELQRREAAKGASDFGDFLAQLEVSVEMSAAEPEDIPRIAQLTQRTNQFNTTTLRRTEAQVLAFANGATTEVKRVVVSDRFGNYGLTGALFIERETNEWHVNGFLLSCRVLGRGVEHEIVTCLAQDAALAGAGTLVINFAVSARNQPAKLFLDSLASATIENREQKGCIDYRLPVSQSSRFSPTALESESPEGAAAKKDTRAVIGDSIEAVTHSISALRPRWTFYQSVAELATAGSIEAAMRSMATTVRRVTSHAGAPQPPSSSAEIVLAKLWQELLNVENIDLRDEFFALGGHSLKAVMLLSRLRVQHGVALELQDIQNNPTLESFARLVEGALDKGESQAWPVLEKMPDATDYPTSPGQARLWMLEKIRGEGPSPFHMQAALVFDGSCDRQALDSALCALLEEHEILRTSIQENEKGEPRQHLLRSDDAALSCQWLEEPLTRAELLKTGQEFAQRPFDLSRPPLIRLLATPLTGADDSPRFALVIVMHHIISDGWSIGVFATQLSALYARYSESTKEIKAEDWVEREVQTSAYVQYRDYAQWIEQSLVSDAGQKSSAYWQEKFREPVDALTLPTDRPRPPIKGSVGATLELSVSASAWGAYQAMASQRGLTQFSALLAALEFVLARFSGQTNFCVGTPVAGRTHPALESLIGFFVNVLPLRATVGLDWTVEEFLAAVSSEVSASLSNQTLPFDSIIDKLDLPRDMSRSPLFDVLLVLQNASEASVKLGAAEGEVLRVDSATSQYDIAVNAFPLPDQSLKLVVDYDTALFDPTRIQRLIASLEIAMAAMAEKPGASLCDLAWVPRSDVLRLRDVEGALVAADKRSLPELVLAAADTAKGLLSDEEAVWSYKELIAQMSLVARALSKIEQGAVVGVLGARSLRSVSAMLGVMQAGCIYLPLDSANPLARLQAIAMDAGVCALLITDEQSAHVAGDIVEDNRVIHYFSDGKVSGFSPSGLSVLSAVSAEKELAEVKSPASADAIAYTIYTSGSTGKPKGVRVSHASFATMIRAQAPAFSIDSHAVCGQFATLAFDASLSEIFLALTQGASLAIAPDMARQDIGVFLDWIERAGVTAITLPPAFVRALDRKKIPGLKVLITAGEAADASDLAHYAQDMTVINAYGPTETSVCATTYRVDAKDKWPFGVPIGKPLAGTLISVRDTQGKPVALGVEGELYIGGPTVARGYHARPELNAERFISDLPERPDIRWYRSGDRCRWREDGLLEFVGRNDAQLKVRGFRIEPGEIEQALRDLSEVTDAAVVLDSLYGLIAYVSIVDDRLRETADPQIILERLATVLPSYMIPSQLVLLQELPRTIAGKIDRPRLPRPAEKLQAGFSEPVGDNEITLAQIWQRVLGERSNTKQVGRDDDFFGLGGDSIKALRVISELRAQSLKLDIRQLFAQPLLRDSATLLLPIACTADSSADEYALVGQVPLLPPQRWYLHRQAIDSLGQFNIVIELALNAPIETLQLESAFKRLLEAHASLRASFNKVDGEWQQHIRSPEALSFSLVEFDSAIEGESVQTVAETAITRPFLIGSDTLLRCVRVTQGDSSSLFVAVHHLVADWVSMRVLVEDLNAVLAGQELASDGRLLGEQAQDRARVSSRMERQATERSVDDAFALLEAHSLVPGSHAELVTQHFSLTSRQTTRLIEQLGDIKLHEFILHHSTLALAQLLGMKMLPVLVEGHGRSELSSSRSLEKLVAWLTQAKLVWVTPSRDDSEGLSRARECLLTLRNSDSDVFPIVAPEKTTLPAVLSFNYLGEFDDATQSVETLPAVTLTPRVFEGAMAAKTHADVPLHLEFYVVNGGFELQVAWSPAAFGDKNIDEYWRSLTKRLAQLAGDGA